MTNGQSSSGDLFAIGVRGKERIDFGRIRKFHFEEPPAGIGFAVDQSRIVHDGFVGFCHLATDR